MPEENGEQKQPLKQATAAAADSRSRIARAQLAINNVIAQVSDAGKLEEIAKGLEGAAGYIRKAAGYPPASTGPSREFKSSSSD